MALLNHMTIFLSSILVLAVVHNLGVAVEGHKDSAAGSMGRLLPGIIANPSTDDEYTPECDGWSGCNESPGICGEECRCDDGLNLCYAPHCHVNQTCENGGACDPECQCVEPELVCNTRH